MTAIRKARLNWALELLRGVLIALNVAIAVWIGFGGWQWLVWIALMSYPPAILWAVVTMSIPVLALWATFSKNKTTVGWRIGAIALALAALLIGPRIEPQLRFYVGQPQRMAFLEDPDTRPCPSRVCTLDVVSGGYVFIDWGIIDNFVGVCFDPKGVLADIEARRRQSVYFAKENVVGARSMGDGWYLCSGT